MLDSIGGPESTRAYLSAGGGVVGCSLGRRSGGNQVWFIDASDPADLKSASVVTSSEYAEDLACNGSIACVFNFMVLDIYDTSNPYQPSIIGGAVHWSWYPGEIELAGDILFGSVEYEAYGALLAFDVSNPSQPMSLGNPVGWGPWSVAPSGRGALMLDEHALKAVSVDPTLAVVGTYQSVGRVFAADVEGDHLVFTSDTGAYFYDVSDPRLPVRTGSVGGFWGLGSKVRIQDELAYLSADPGLRVYDLSPPTGPALISTTPVPFLFQIDVDGSVGIGASWSNPSSVVVFDLSDPTRPVVSQALTLPPYVRPQDVAIEGEIALVAADTLYVLDVSDPNSPRVVSSLLSRPDQVVLENGIGYVSVRLGGTGTIIDLSDPANPIVIGNPPLPWLMDLAVSGDLLYASFFTPPELWVFDVTDPNSLSVVGSFNAPYQARDVAADDFGKVALARSGNGLSLLEACRPCYPDCTQTTGLGVLDIFDFLCFQNSFVSGEPYACGCDPDPACDIFDFLCFQNAFVAGCP